MSDANSTPRTNPGRELLEHFAPNPDVAWSDDSPVLAFYDDLRQRIVKIEEAAAGLAVEELARANPGPAAAPLEPPLPTEQPCVNCQNRGVVCYRADSGTAQPSLDVERLLAAVRDHCHDSADEGVPILLRHNHLEPFVLDDCGPAIIRALGAASERPEAPE